MAHRLSRTEKGKWKDENPIRKPLVKIPQTNIEDLIERNRLTLIGRVTNPSIQRTRALVDFFLQQWNVVGRITGRDLGPSLFQFQFETEHDLQTILNKSPFHFKRWMMILQRWEPIVSDSFPSRITFWINVHGIPLHYWNDATIDAIGAAPGPIESRVADKAKLRVQVNGLEPLIMHMDIQLPSREVVEIELEYEKLEKHCFYCKALSHEDEDCPLRPHHQHPGDRKNLGISQHNTLAKIQEDKRRQEARKQSRLQQPRGRDGAKWPNYKGSDSRANLSLSQHDSRRQDSHQSSEFEENRRRYDDRIFSRRSSPAEQRPSTRHRSSQSRDSRDPIERRSTSLQAHRDHQGHKCPSGLSPAKDDFPRSDHQGYSSARDSLIASQRSHPHTDRENRVPAKERISSPILATSSASHQSPASNKSPASIPTSNLRRETLASRLSGLQSSDDRVPAKERLSVQTQRILNEPAQSNSGSRHRQEEITSPLEATRQSPALNALTRPSSSNVFDSDRLGICERSPIRTLIEDRIHVSLRLGPLLSDTTETDSGEEYQPFQSRGLSDKAAGKRTLSTSVAKKRSTKSPAKEGAPKRRRTTKTTNSPRRKLLMDAITAGGKATSNTKKRQPPARIREFRKRISPAILFLMETKNQDDAIFPLFQNSDLSNHFTVPPIGLAGGLSLSWRDDIQVEILYSSANIIDTRIFALGSSSFVSFIYGAPNPADRPNFWNKLTELGADREDAWLLTGDFNDLLDNSEKVGGPARWEGSFLSFRNFVSQMGLWDLQHSGNHLSWRGTRYNHFIQSRLDRAMANCSWFERFPAGRSEYLRFEGSDHRPIVVHFDVTTKKKKGLFRFDRRLKDKPEIRQIVPDRWKLDQHASVFEKICNVRHNIILWVREKNLNSNLAIQELQIKLEAALSCISPDTEAIGKLTTDLEKAYEEEELYWRQRSRIQWLSCGDRNTSFFHATTRSRRAVNKFSVIETPEGIAVYKEDEIVRYAVWDPITGNCGLGWQLRDANNLIAENSSSHRRSVPSALVAEALAVKATLFAAASSHVRSLTMYSDSKKLVALLKNQGQDVALQGVLHDIRLLARSLDSISFHFIPCLSNIDADTLAKTALFYLPASTTIVV
ncbi:hypothetical protein Bca52824_014159 [Brassica carinata]|uniref:RNase H type-1 domain-containing protein n=1 Tax=Brassica carinata TaxID=52824 RepID=A0A8X7VZV4_BRACI|nr:hypothetical protein Bca52824_014159 [Brassica carinata]